MGAQVVAELSGIVKRFGAATALDGLDLAVHPGEVHGFLGPNGAGKTTAIRVLLGLIRADAGAAQVLGLDPWRNTADLHRRLAYVPGDVSLWPNLSGGEVLDLLGRLRGGLDEPRRGEMIERFKLDPTKKCRAYSKGNRQKVALVAALAADLELLVLDEPTAGLDPLMEEEFQACVREACDRGVSVLLSSHILSEVEALADRVTIVRDGRAVESGTLRELRHLTATTVKIQLRNPDVAALQGIPGVMDVVASDGVVTAQVGAGAMQEFLSRAASLGVESLSANPPTLEDMFLRHYDVG